MNEEATVNGESTVNQVTTVLVTGASGFIASHCILQLLQQGYRVRGTIRTPSRADEVRQTMARHWGGDIGRLDLTVADLSQDDGWDRAVAGCRYVLHVASPISLSMPKDEMDMIGPAREGTLRVLRAAVAAGVERVVQTSSIAAIMAGRGDNGGKPFDEDDWSDLDGQGVTPYDKSKTLAEQSAWDFINSNEAGPMTLAVINPAVVLGPVLNADMGVSAEVVRRLLIGKPPAIPHIGFAVVDVRDVATAHIAAMTIADAGGERFCCVNGSAWFKELADILREPCAAKGFKVPSRRMPDWMLKFVGLFHPAVRSVSNRLGLKRELSNEKIRRILHWQPRDLAEMTLATAETLIEHKIV